MKILYESMMVCPYDVLVDFIMFDNGYAQKDKRSKQFGTRLIIKKGTKVSIKDFYKHSDGSIAFKIMTDDPVVEAKDEEDPEEDNNGYATTYLAYESKIEAIEDGWHV